MKIKLYDFYAVVKLKRGNGVYCSCGNHLYEISNGIFDTLWICEKCHTIWQLELRKVNKNKIDKDFMKQSLIELEKVITK